VGKGKEETSGGVKHLGKKTEGRETRGELQKSLERKRVVQGLLKKGKRRDEGGANKANED